MAENFLLIHGAYHGAWCWAAVANCLEQLGHRAVAIDLPGHGASRYPREQIDLATYTNAVVNFVQGANLCDLVIVGHSMAGIVLTTAAPQLLARLKRLIFVSALVLHDGERAADFIPPQRARLLDGALARPDRCLEVGPEFIERFRATFIQDASRDLQDFVIAGLGPQPICGYLERVANAAFFDLDLPTSYVVLEDDLAQGPQGFQLRYLPRLKNPSIRSIKSGHEVMFTRPRELARALAELASGR